MSNGHYCCERAWLQLCEMCKCASPLALLLNIACKVCVRSSGTATVLSKVVLSASMHDCVTSTAAAHNQVAEYKHALLTLGECA
jgi:hypothetical protein